MLYGEKMKMIIDEFGIDTSTLPNNLYSTLLDEIYNSNVSGVDNNRFYMVKDTKRLYDKLALWGYGGFRGNADFQAVAPYTTNYQTFTTDVMDLSNYSKAVIKFTAIEYYTDTSYPTDIHFTLASTPYSSDLSTGNGYIKDEYVIKKVTKTIEDINNGFKGAYVTLEIDLTDVSVGAILLESCKCCTTILDFWLE